MKTEMLETIEDSALEAVSGGGIGRAIGGVIDGALGLVGHVIGGGLSAVGGVLSGLGSFLGRLGRRGH
jgi:hypothetical protein